MGLIDLIIIIVLIGVAMWVINTYIPMDAKIKNILNIVVVIALVLWIVSLFIGGLPNVRIGR